MTEWLRRRGHQFLCSSPRIEIVRCVCVCACTLSSVFLFCAGHRSRFSSVCLATAAVGALTMYQVCVPRLEVKLNASKCVQVTTPCVCVSCTHYILTAQCSLYARFKCVHMALPRHFSSWKKPSASISATRCARRKFFIRFCFRKLFSSHFVRTFFIWYFFFSLYFSPFLRRSSAVKYLVHTRALRIVENRDCLSSLLPHELCARASHIIAVRWGRAFVHGPDILVCTSIRERLRSNGHARNKRSF